MLSWVQNTAPPTHSSALSRDSWTRLIRVGSSQVFRPEFDPQLLGKLLADTRVNVLKIAPGRDQGDHVLNVLPANGKRLRDRLPLKNSLELGPQRVVLKVFFERILPSKRQLLVRCN